MTFPENWPDDVRDLAARTISLELSADDMMAIGGFTPEFRESMAYQGSIAISEALTEAIDDAMARLPKGAMPRLGYCSWKASTVQHAQCFGTRGVMAVLCQQDPRVASALEIHLTGDEPAFLHLREWRDIPAWSECRMFVQDGRIIGVSQYAYQEAFTDQTADRAAIQKSISDFADALLPLLHLKDVIVDLYINDAGKAELIEMNPFSRNTDPCLFSWDKPEDFNGALRLVGDLR